MVRMPLPATDITLNLTDLPIKVHINIGLNQTFWWKGQLTYTDENNNTANVNLANATTKEICLETPVGIDKKITLTNVTSAGEFEILIKPSDITGMVAQDYRWDCDIVLPVGNATFPAGISLRIFEGIATLREEVSN